MPQRDERIDAEVEAKIEKMEELRSLMKKCRLRLLSDGDFWFLIGPSTTLLEPCSVHGDVDELEASLNTLLERFDLLEHKPNNTAH